MIDAKRMQIRERIETGLARQEAREGSAFAERAEQAREKVVYAAREHPLLLIAGGLVVGVALSALLPKSPTRKYSKYAFNALSTLAELGIAYSRNALETAGEAAEDAVNAGKEKVGKLKRNLEDKRAEKRGATAKELED